jgi:hypothetical protein
MRGLSDSRLSEILVERARHGVSASIARTEVSRPPGFVFMRPPCKGIDCPEGDGDGPPQNPCRGLPFVWQPDIAVKITLPCPEQSDLDRITQAVRGNLAPFKFPNPDVRVSCDPESPSFTILIWPTPVTPNSCNDLARRRAELPIYMNRHGAFGIYIAAALIRNLAQAAFDATPKRLDGSGAPSPDGPIHLTGLLIDFVEHDVDKTDNSTVVTYINGYDERPWPDVGFTVTLTDVLTSDPTLHAVTTSKVTTSDRDEFLALNLLPIAFVLSILPPTTFLLLNDLEAYQVRPHDSSTDSLGERILATIPDEISLPHTGGLPHPLALPRLASAGEGILTAMPESRKMVVISYGTPIVNDSGIYLSGAVQNPFPNRVPKARIIGYELGNGP